MRGLVCYTCGNVHIVLSVHCHTQRITPIIILIFVIKSTEIEYELRNENVNVNFVQFMSVGGAGQ